MPASRVTIGPAGLNQVLQTLQGDGYDVVGPTVRDGAIVYDTVRDLGDLPRGWTDVQEAGRYRLERRGDDSFFGFAVGPHSWKRYLHPPVLRLWQASREGDTWTVEPEPSPERKLALLGVRPCELAAIQIQDRVFLEGAYVDPHYASRRARVFIIAVNCSTAGGTCFCASMKTGPRTASGFDLALTELRSSILVEIATDAGRAAMRDVPAEPATPEDLDAAEAIIERTASGMGRSMRTEGIKELLYRNREHARWDQVAQRCLACTNCTMVCPTCFCTSVHEVTDLAGQAAARERTWDSCFTLDFSYVHGGSVRPSHRARYRHWLTHKLASWFDQFASSGCVGCGRCVTWCPVGIDLTEEVKAIQDSDGGGQP